MEQTKDFFTPEMYKKYISSNIDPKQIVWRCGKWGILRTPDGKHRDGVPQCVEGEGTGTWSCFNQHFVGQRQHRSMCSQSVWIHTVLCNNYAAARDLKWELSWCAQAVCEGCAL
jgi:hypothetical protein